MKETDLAWMAGIFDGEGFVRIAKIKVGLNRRRTPSYQVVAAVAMTHRPTIDRLLVISNVGKVKEQRARHKNHNATFLWQTTDRKASATLIQLRPYLVTKSERADLAIEFVDRCYQRPGAQDVSDDLALLREEYFQRMKALNKRGK